MKEGGQAIAINILDFEYLPFEEYHNCYRMKNTRNNHELTDVFEINFIELPKASKNAGNNLKDLWMLFLDAKSEEVLNMLENEDPVFEKAVNKLLYVSADEKLRYELDMREKAELDYNSAMIMSYRKGQAEKEAEVKAAKVEAEAAKAEAEAAKVAKAEAEAAKAKAETAEAKAKAEAGKKNLAKAMLIDGESPEKISGWLQIPLAEILNIKASLNQP